MAMGAWKRSIRTVGAVTASAGVLAIVLGLLVLAVRPTGGQAAGGVIAEGGPRFRVDGPDADSFGRGEGYPVCKGSEYAQKAALSHRRVQPLRPALSLTNHQGPRGTDPPGPRHGGARDQLHVQRAAPDDRSVSRQAPGDRVPDREGRFHS